jgi:hypothetical protein
MNAQDPRFRHDVERNIVFGYTVPRSIELAAVKQAERDRGATAHESLMHFLLTGKSGDDR